MVQNGGWTTFPLKDGMFLPMNLTLVSWGQLCIRASRGIWKGFFVVREDPGSLHHQLDLRCVQFDCGLIWPFCTRASGGLFQHVSTISTTSRSSTKISCRGAGHGSTVSLWCSWAEMELGAAGKESYRGREPPVFHNGGPVQHFKKSP